MEVAGTTLFRFLQARLAGALARSALRAPDARPAAREVPLEVPPDPAFGDWSTPVALRLAGRLRRPPLDVAAELKAALEDDPDLAPWVSQITVSRPGYVNLRLDGAALAAAVVRQALARRDRYGDVPPGSLDEAVGQGKVLIEHTAINPNKAAHIGHLRNACIGDTLARLYRKAGFRVEVQNYIDDTGTTVADVLVGLETLGRRPEPGQRWDYFCWDLYTEVNARYEQEPALAEARRRLLQLVEEGDNDVARLGRLVADRNARWHLWTMWRLGIFYDLLSWESDIIALGFWRHAFDVLKRGGALQFETEGPNAGCWVVRLGDVPGFEAMENPDKILVRSDGTATYTAKDLAYQLWKFGVLGRDFYYQPYTRQPTGRWLWSTVTDPGASHQEVGERGGEGEADGDGQAAESATGAGLAPPAGTILADLVEGYRLAVGGYGSEAQGELAEPPPEGFGRADRVINVIDIRQKYLQDVLRAGLQKLGYEAQARQSVHFGYEVVALSPQAARELGAEVDEAAGAVAMAGRKGIGVKADDLVDLARQKAATEVAARHPEWSAAECERVAHQIAVGAVRYYMTRFNLQTVIVFDFADALNYQGNTGPYLQYAHARAASILRKAAGGAGPVTPGAPVPVPAELEAGPPEPPAELHPAEAALARKLADLPEALARAIETGSPALVCDYAYGLATAFTDFYEAVPVLTAPERVRTFRLGLVAAFRQSMANTLDVLGIPGPTVM